MSNKKENITYVEPTVEDEELIKFALRRLRDDCQRLLIKLGDVPEVIEVRREEEDG